MALGDEPRQQVDQELAGVDGGADRALGVAQGDRHHEAALRTNLADRLRASADLDATIARLTSAAGIDAVAGELQPEIWQPTEWRWWCSMSRLAPGSVPWAIAERPAIARYARSPWFMREEVE